MDVYKSKVDSRKVIHHHLDTKHFKLVCNGSFTATQTCLLLLRWKIGAESTFHSEEMEMYEL